MYVLTDHCQSAAGELLGRVGGDLAGVEAGKVGGEVGQGDGETRGGAVTKLSVGGESRVQQAGHRPVVGQEHQERGGGAAAVPLHIQLGQPGLRHAVVAGKVRGATRHRVSWDGQLLDGKPVHTGQQDGQDQQLGRHGGPQSVLR